MLQLNPTTSLLLQESKAEQRMSVHNKDILQVWWGLNSFYPSALSILFFNQNNVLECM